MLAAPVLAGAVAGVARSAPLARRPERPAAGTARILHITDTHAQIEPVYFREPSANIGVGEAKGRAPHLVGRAMLEHFGIEPGGRASYAASFLDFEAAARRYGPMGGFAHIKTLLDQLRDEVGPDRSLTLDGGDLWQGSAVAHRSGGAAMVELGNMLGIDAMTGHWEFTYGPEQLRRNLGSFRGVFLAQNVFLTEEAAFAGARAFDGATGRVFQPALLRVIGGLRIAVIGQAFPYVPIAHPRRFVPDWTFGIHPGPLQALVADLREHRHADIVLLLSHNGMDVDLKLAGLVWGIDVILGGHTHDVVPRPSRVANARGTTLVANGGCSGKFVGVLDIARVRGRAPRLDYRLEPVFSELLVPDPAVSARIAALRAAHAATLDEPLTEAAALLFRRGNFNGTMDDLLCDALLAEPGVDVAISPGFRWGPSFLRGQSITMEDVLAHTAITYPDVYTQSVTGAELKAILEDSCDNLFNPDPFLQQGGDMARVGGLSYVCRPSNPMGRRIGDMRLRDGSEVDPARTYRMASWASTTLPQGSRPIWDVVASHLRAAPARASASASAGAGAGAEAGAATSVLVRGENDNPGYART